MKRFLSQTGPIILSAILILGSLTAAYIQRLRVAVWADQVNGTLQTVSTEDNYFKQKSAIQANLAKQKDEELQQKQAELDAKQAELQSKQAELDKTNQQLTQKLTELKSAQSQLSANAAELSKLRSRPPLFVFSVESSKLANADQKKADIKNVVTQAYPVIESIYGEPYLLHSVTIAFVDTFTNPNAAAEIVITNGNQGLSLTIHLKDFDKNNFNDVNSIIHEIIHSFHGLSVLSPVAYEEGITVAATDAVMARLESQGSIPNFDPLYIRISDSTYKNYSATIPSGDSAFYTSDSVADYYQIEGYGWYQLYKANPNFFKTFNEKIYDQKHQGKVIDGDMVRSILHQTVTSNVDGKSASDWLNTKAFALN